MGMDHRTRINAQVVVKRLPYPGLKPHKTTKHEADRTREPLKQARPWWGGPGVVARCIGASKDSTQPDPPPVL